MAINRRITCISGTPGTGKSTIGDALHRRGFPVIEVERYSSERGVYCYVEQGDTLVIDTDELVDSFSRFLRTRPELVVVGHLSHNIAEADAVVVLRTHPAKLQARLESKGWPAPKIQENVEAEALGVCLGEALELHGDKVSEIDTTEAPVKETVGKVLAVHAQGRRFPPRSRDWLLEHILKSVRN